MAHDAHNQPTRKEPFSFADGLSTDILCIFVYLHDMIFFTHNLQKVTAVCTRMLWNVASVGLNFKQY